MAAVPSSISTAFVSSGSTIAQPAGFGGDNGVGFHSSQPVRIERHDDTENVHNRDKLKQSDGDLVADGQVANYPKYHESPYVRYVSRPLSSGNLSTGVQTYTPEDRSKMGQPLNPFWIRNDLWSMENEADIFMDAGPNWVAPRLAAHTKQSAQMERDTYLDNEQQPQHSSQPAPITIEAAPTPVAPIAGQVTSAVGVSASDTSGTLDMKDANPAKTNKEDDGSAPIEQDIDAKRKRGDEASKGEEGSDKVTPPSSSTASGPPKKKSRGGGKAKK